jgi:hypothetical protein
MSTRQLLEEVASYHTGKRPVSYMAAINAARQVNVELERHLAFKGLFSCLLGKLTIRCVEKVLLQRTKFGAAVNEQKKRDNSAQIS